MPAGVTNFPTSLDSTTNLPDVTGKNQNDGSGDTNAIHSNIHDTADSAIIAVETKLGTGSSVPTTTGHVLTVTGAGASAWQAVGAGIPSSTVTNVDFTSGSTAGSASAYSRGDHKHRSDRFLLPFVWTLDTVTSPLTLNYTLPVPVAADLFALNLALTTPASAGSNTKVNLLVNGTTRLSTQPEIVVGQSTNSIAAVFSSTSLSVGQLITVATTQGSSGGPLTIVLLLQIQVPA